MSKRYKKHNIEDRIKYIKMIEEGYSKDYICNRYGFDHRLLSVLWLRYQKEGPLGLMKKHNIRADGAYREKVLRDIAENCLPLSEAAAKYDVSVSQIKALEDRNITQSMSRKGNCLDNAIMENFFGLMKNELLYLKEWDSIDQFKTALREYIRYYNNDRIKLRLKGKSPVQYRALFQSKAS